MGQKAANKILDGLKDAEAYMRIDTLLRRQRAAMKKAPKLTNDWDVGYRDGLFDARELFGKTHTFKIKKTSDKP